MAYLDDHPNPNTPQQRRPRRAPLSGTVGVHTAESIMDTIGPDTGAENVAAFIASRSDYGSYHVLVDSDSVVVMAGDDAETWHIAESDNFGYGMNSHSWGISAACSSHQWDPDDEWTKRTIAAMGAEIRAFWQRNGFDVAECARWLTRDQAKNRTPGLVHHGVVQPSDRSDAWVRHPQKPELDQMLLDAIKGGPAKEWDEMATQDEIRAIVADEVKKAIVGIEWAEVAQAMQLIGHGPKDNPTLRDVSERTYNGVRALVDKAGVDTSVMD